MYEQQILDAGVLEIVHEDMAKLSKEDKQLFTMARRMGLGASDASIILGVNIWITLEDLIKQKQSTVITAEELAIGEKENVRKGSDLEPLILQKFSEKFMIPVSKPSPMYRVKNHPQLTINYDGVCMVGDQLIPVEAKYASPYANKYYERGKCINALWEGNMYTVGNPDVAKHIEEVSKLYGIPPYYYTQCQQQMLGLNAPFCYLAVLFDKGWELGVYKIYQDVFVQDALVNRSVTVWDKVKGV